MDQDYRTMQEERPSPFAAFIGGFGSGAMSGGLMTGIVAGLSLLILAHPITWAAAAIMVLSPALFVGFTSAKRAMFDAPTHSGSGQGFNQTVIATPAITAPSMATPSLDAAEEALLPEAERDEPPAKNWVAQTGRGGEASSSIQQILAHGAMSDKDRAAAILAKRESASASTARSA